MTQEKPSALLTMMPKGVEHRGCAAQVLVFVLNAFRHHRNSHSRESVLVVSCFACSTPFGIIGILTICQKESQKVENGCSTPFGIIGILTSGTFTTTAANESAQRLSASSEFSLSALCIRVTANCLCSTPFGIIGILTPSILSFCRRKKCAQRLSASSEFSRQGGWNICLVNLVLNAFRHHRNSHTGTAQEDVDGVWCSTPFGIIGILTSLLVNPSEVL